MGWGMVVEIHADVDSKKAADRRHDDQPSLAQLQVRGASFARLGAERAIPTFPAQCTNHRSNPFPITLVHSNGLTV